MSTPLYVDPDQRFTCAECGRCCRRWEILASAAEVEWLRGRHAERLFRERVDAPEGTSIDPFEPAPGWPGHYRIRKRGDGGCGFLSLEGRCRIHEEHGANRKPLTCRSFPFSFHQTPASVMVTASFGCPTVVANRGEPWSDGARLDELKKLRTEWLSGQPATAAPRAYVTGRSIDAKSLQVLRESLLRMLARRDPNGAIRIRDNVNRMARTLEDLTRRRVAGLPDADFAEYVGLTVPHAAGSDQSVTLHAPSRIGRLLQHGFLFIVTAIRLRLDRHDDTRWQMRIAILRLLAHFHRLGPGVGRVDLWAHDTPAVDVDAPGIQTIVYRYLQARITTLGTGGRTVLDELAIAVSQLNAACRLAVMNARAEGKTVDSRIFTEALMEAADASQIDGRGLVGRALARFAGGVEALDVLSAS